MQYSEAAILGLNCHCKPGREDTAVESVLGYPGCSAPDCTVRRPGTENWCLIEAADPGPCGYCKLVRWGRVAGYSPRLRSKHTHYRSSTDSARRLSPQAIHMTMMNPRRNFPTDGRIAGILPHVKDRHNRPCRSRQKYTLPDLLGQYSGSIGVQTAGIL